MACCIKECYFWYGLFFLLQNILYFGNTVTVSGLHNYSNLVENVNYSLSYQTAIMNENKYNNNIYPFRYKPPELELLFIHLNANSYSIGCHILPEFVNLAGTVGGLLMHYAVNESNLNLLENLIDSESDLNIEDILGVTPLYRAVQTNNKEAQKMLINAGANLNYVSTNGITFLQKSIISDDLNTTERLIDLGVDLNALSINGIPALYNAAEGNNQQFTTLLIKNGANINIELNQGQSLLHLAVIKGKMDVTKNLIDAGIIIDTFDNFGKTPLYYAIDFEYLGIIKLLLDNGARSSAMAIDNQTLLHTAVAEDKLKVISRLISLGATTDVTGRDQLTPLCQAIMLNKIEVLREMLKLKTDPNLRCHSSRKTYPLHLAVSNGSTEFLLELLKNSAKTSILNDEGFSPLVMAIFLDKTNMVELLSNRSKDLNYKIHGEENTPLHEAVIANNWKAAETLLMHGAKVDAVNLNGLTPLGIAATRNDKNIIRVLQQHGADINFLTPFGDTPLHLAVLSKNIHLIATLCSYGAGINYYNTRGLTPLCVAIGMNQSRIANALLVQGADVNAICQDTTPYLLTISNSTLKMLLRLTSLGAERKENFTALTYKAAKADNPQIMMYFLGMTNSSSKLLQDLMLLSAASGSSRILKELIKKGADVNHASSDGLTPLWYATRHNKNDTINILLENGANPYISILCNKDGLKLSNWTLLHEASFNGHFEAVKVLLQNGVDTEARDGRQWTPLHYAAAQHNVEVVKELLEYGADIKSQTKQGELPVNLLMHRRTYEEIMYKWLTMGLKGE